MMFGSKKNRIVAPRPQPPSSDQIMEDLKCSNNDDVALNIFKNDKSNDEDLHFPTNANDSIDVYKKVKTYLDVNQKLRTIDSSLCENIELLKDIDQDIMKLAQEIKSQAQAALME